MTIDRLAVFAHACTLTMPAALHLWLGDSPLQLLILRFGTWQDDTRPCR